MKEANPKEVAFQAWSAAHERSLGPPVNGLETELRRAAFEKWWIEQSPVDGITPAEIEWLRAATTKWKDPTRGYALERGGGSINAVNLLLRKIDELEQDKRRLREENKTLRQTALDWITKEGT